MPTSLTVISPEAPLIFIVSPSTTRITLPYSAAQTLKPSPEANW
jgi:hypothetical protein